MGAHLTKLHVHDHVKTTTIGASKGTTAGATQGKVKTKPAKKVANIDDDVRDEDGILPAPLPFEAYDALFPWAPPTYTSLETDKAHPASEEPYDDPLVAATRHNQARPFPQLPDGVVLLVASHLDDTAVECLRRASRRFPPLLAEAVRARDFYEGKKLALLRRGPFPWPRLWSIKSDKPEGRALLRLLDSDRYCAGCLRAREAPDWLDRVGRLRRYLRCAVCGVEHPACLFSAEQRRRPLRRRCIAHEGFIRLCAHDGGIVRWSDVVKLRRDAVANGELFKSRGCMDNSHFTACGEPGRDIKALAEKLSEHCKYEMPSMRYGLPTLGVVRNVNNGFGEGDTIVMFWLAHIPLGRLGEWPPTASTLRRRLAELEDNAGRFMTQTTQPHIQELQALRCFDPNDCECVYFEGSEDVDWRPYRPLHQKPHMLHGSDEAASKCYLDSARRLTPFPQHRRPSPSTRDRQLEKMSSEPIRICKPDAARCGIAEKCHKTRNRVTKMKSLYGPGLLNISVDLCHSDSPCLRVKYHRNISGPGPLETNIPEGWYQSLDPDSYGLTNDEDGRGVYWCREPECCNYYRGPPNFNRLLSGYRHLYQQDRLQCLQYHRT